MSQDPTPREMGYYLALGQIGVEMVLPTLLGYWIDGWLETTPWITIIAAVVGFAAGMIHLIVILRQKERDESSDKKPPP
jgi:ATP synthase protein I